MKGALGNLDSMMAHAPFYLGSACGSILTACVASRRPKMLQVGRRCADACAMRVGMHMWACCMLVGGCERVHVHMCRGLCICLAGRTVRAVPNSEAASPPRLQATFLGTIMFRGLLYILVSQNITRVSTCVRVVCGQVSIACPGCFAHRIRPASPLLRAQFPTPCSSDQACKSAPARPVTHALFHVTPSLAQILYSCQLMFRHLAGDFYLELAYALTEQVRHW